MNPRLLRLLLILGTAALPAQTGSTALRHVEGRPVIRVDLQAGERSYPCHLLVDLSLPVPLFLHNNAARSLRARAVDLVSGKLQLPALPVTAGGDPFLERLTADQAEALGEVPVAGAIGPAAFADQTLVLDGPGKRLRLLPPSLEAEAPRRAPGRLVLDLHGEASGTGYSIRARLGREQHCALRLNTRHPFCFAAANLLEKAQGGFRLGALDLLQAAAWRPIRIPQAEAGLGARLLQQMKLTLQPGPQRLILEYSKAPQRSDLEAAFYAARYRQKGNMQALSEFLREHPNSPFSLEAARDLLGLELRASEPDLLRRGLAALAWIGAVPAKKRGTTALRILGSLPDDFQHRSLRRDLASMSLEDARRDLDGNAVHKLRLELGRLARRERDLKSARRHLLSAAFGMPTDGPTSLELGRVYEAMGQLPRAQGRYFLAMLDAKQTPVDGYLALRSVYKKIHGHARGLSASLVPMAEGRVPALHPIPRKQEPQGAKPHRVLVELFTGAHCPPCVAADVACDALDGYFRHGEVQIIQWHLPIPAPEPLVNRSARHRARDRGIRSTPNLLLNGHQLVRGGGPKEQAAPVFSKYRKAVEAMLGQPCPVQIRAMAWREGRTVKVRASATGGDDLRLHLVLCEKSVVYPGRNGMLFHHHVARARISPAEGIPAQNAGLQGLDLDTLQQQLEADLVEMEEAGAEFRIRPTRPDPDQLVLVCFATAGAEGRILQSLTVPLASSRPR